MHRSILSVAVLTFAVVIAPASALAASVYLNGVRIDGVTNKKFDKASVRIDEKGDVYITAVGYAVHTETVTVPAPAPATPPAAPAPAAPAATPAPAPATPAAAPATPPKTAEPEGPPTLTKRYWLFTEQSVPGMSEYDIDLYINSKWIRKLRNNEDQVITDVTQHLQPGKNTILLNAHKVVAGDRKSYSPRHYFKVIIGEGNMGGQNVMIDNPIIKFTRTAADDKDSSEEFTLTTR